MFISGWGGRRVTVARGGGNGGGPSPGRRRVRGFLRVGGAALEGEVREERLFGVGRGWSYLKRCLPACGSCPRGLQGVPE